VSGGIDGAGNASVTPEVYSASTNSWRSLFGASSSSIFGGNESRWWYPRQWVAPNGQIFGMTGSAMYYLSANGNGSINKVGTVPARSRNYRSTAVMYAPGKILQAGGEGNNGAIIVDINNYNPVVTNAQSMSFNRNSWANSTVLPDGKVLVIGGSPSDNGLSGAALAPELWDPVTNSWTILADAQLARLYHSTSLLLPDGRVLIAGGGAPGPLTNTNAEIFTPPYLLNNDNTLATRLTIYSAPDSAVHGQNITLSHSTNRTVERVTLIKTGAVTHSFNMDQRFIELDFNGNNGQVNATLPASANIAPPGYYMMFLIDQNGTPSVGKMINIELDEVDEPEPTFTLTNSPEIGRTGGNPFSVDCGTDQVLAGIDVRAGYALDAIAPRCVSVNANGDWIGNPSRRGGLKGGSGGSLRTSQCPSNYAVVGYNGSRGGGWYDFVAGYIQLNCRKLNSPVSVSGGITTLSSAGVRQSGSARAFICSSNRPSRGLYGRSGALVDQYGLRCLTEQ